MSAALDKPLVEIDHIKAHVYANFLTDEQPRLPAVGLIVSGGHTDLYSVRDIQTFRRIGKTRDDAAGEAFDKVARVLGLGYPGGPAIDRLSKSVPETEITFKYAALEGTLDFSFSGVKQPFCITGRNTGTIITIRPLKSPARSRKVSLRYW